MVVTEEWYESWRACQLVYPSVYPSVELPMWHLRQRGTGMLLMGFWGGRWNVRYHPTLNLSFAMLSTVSSAAGDP